jgi:Domain of unknown function (DUF4136)
MESTTRRAVTVCCFVITLVLAAIVATGAKVKVTVQREESFSFVGMRTWAWHPDGAGDVKMALTPDDDPAAVRNRFEPVIIDAVGKALTARGLSTAAAGAEPDLLVRYYVLISTNMSAQTIGQFVPASAWGLPVFSGATQSLRVYEQGSLILDVRAPKSRELVWRGIAQAEIDRDRKPAERDARLRDAIADLVKKIPKTT